MKINKLLKILLVLTFLKGLVWAYIIPPFQSPDEQNHFAYVQYVAETLNLPDIKKNKNASLELIKATQILQFDWHGAHPMWSKQILENSSSIIKEISLIPKTDRKIFISYANGFKNPPLYYLIGAPFYKIGSFGNILNALYTTRILSILFALGSVFLSFKIAQLITKNNILSITTAALISFQPSFTNITSTVTNDSMAVFSVTLATYLILKEKNLGLIGGVIALVTRVHLGVLLIYSLFRKNYLILTFFMLALFFITPASPPYLPLGLDKFIEGIASIRNIVLNPNIFSKTVNFVSISVPHYINEVLPWYFGVFGWLEITLPTVFYAFFKILILLSLAGFILKRKNPYPKITPGVISAVLLFLVIFLFDFITFVQSGEGVGVQGRHFIPAISIHVLLILIGLELLIPKKLITSVMKILITFMVFVNFVSIYLVTSYFYSSSYVSFFMDSRILITIFAFFMLTLSIFLLNVSKLKEDE